jgi:FAD/FMN-containing dehydrogenase
VKGKNMPPLIRIIEMIKTTLGPKGYRDQGDDMAPYLADWRGKGSGKAAIVLLPADTAEVSSIVQACAANNIPMVPQGGNTGLVQGAVPTEAGDEVIINLSRMNKIEEIDLVNSSLVCQAGATLKSVQDAAIDVNRLFPLSIGSEGTCQIGGNLSTNAGGIHVMRYGMARELVLDIEAVLPNGDIYDGIRGLRKDNTGYNLNQLLIGAEGTLGIITKASLKLYPLPKYRRTMMLAFEGVEDSLEALRHLKDHLGDALTAYEILPDKFGLETVLEHIPGTRSPFKARHNWYAIIDCWASATSFADKAAVVEPLEVLLEKAVIRDAVIAESEAQSAQMWKLREVFADALKHDGSLYAFDVSVPISSIPVFIEKVDVATAKILPNMRNTAFGHAGDGNVHYNLGTPAAGNADDVARNYTALSKAVHDVADSLGGSISAEHGIGRLKAHELPHYKSVVALALMKSIKAAIDPKNIMNPGRIFE